MSDDKIITFLSAALFISLLVIHALVKGNKKLLKENSMMMDMIVRYIDKWMS